MNDPIKLACEDQGTSRLKTTLTVWVLYSSERFKRHMMNQLVKCFSINFEMFQQENATPEQLMLVGHPDVIFIETGPNWAQLVIELQNYETRDEPSDGHDTSLLVFGDESDNNALRMALKFGALDFVSDQAQLSDFFGILNTIAADKHASRHLAEVYVFINTKGGAGATTLALNSAIEVARHHPDKVLLLDLDMYFGVAMDYLDLNPKYSISDAIANIADLDEISLCSIITKHESGLHALGFMHENHHENFDQALKLDKLVPVLRENYDYIFVDLSMGMNHIFTPIMTQASKVFLVTQQNLVAIKNASRIAKSLTFEYGITKEHLSLIINRYEKRLPIKVKDITHTISGLEVYTIPNDFKAAIESANLGKPLVSSKKHSAISKSVVELSRTLSPNIQEKKSWFRALFS
jgi:pilus assembly protein CpaE